MTTKSPSGNAKDVSYKHPKVNRFLRATGNAALGLMLLGGMTALAQTQEDIAKYDPKAMQKRIEVYGGVLINAYKPDSNDLIQFGAPIINPMFNGSVARSKAGTIMFDGDASGTNEAVTTANLPASVLSQASTNYISTAATSLRIQYPWDVGTNVYFFKGLYAGYRFRHNTWRYERLNNISQTTIPYIRAKQNSNMAIGGFNVDTKRISMNLSSGIGVGNITFVNGAEEYLKDDDYGPTVGSVSGITVPASAYFGVYLLRNDERHTDVNFLIFGRYDTQMTTAQRYNAVDRIISVGVEIRGRSSK